MGVEPLPVIESKLRSLDVYSAWRLRPDLQVGIVHVDIRRTTRQDCRFAVSRPRSTASGSARDSTICATRRRLYTSPR